MYLALLGLTIESHFIRDNIVAAAEPPLAERCPTSLPSSALPLGMCACASSRACAMPRAPLWARQFELYKTSVPSVHIRMASNRTAQRRDAATNPVLILELEAVLSTA